MRHFQRGNAPAGEIGDQSLSPGRDTVLGFGLQQILLLPRIILLIFPPSSLYSNTKTDSAN